MAHELLTVLFLWRGNFLGKNNVLGYFISRGGSFDEVLADFSSIQKLFHVEYA